jgi:hypothetical protein
MLSFANLVDNHSQQLSPPKSRMEGLGRANKLTCRNEGKQRFLRSGMLDMQYGRRKCRMKLYKTLLRSFFSFPAYQKGKARTRRTLNEAPRSAFTKNEPSRAR